MERLQAFCPLPLKVTWHRNRRLYFSFQKSRQSLHLRLHHSFANASDLLYQALFSYIFRASREAKAHFRKAAEVHFENVPLPCPPLAAQGKVYDLEAIYHDLKARFFSPDYHASIGWSKRTPKSSFRHMTFGVYDRQRRQIRLHPLLDNEAVPFFFVEFIVYHEMLHATCPPLIDARGAVRPHTKEFRRQEKLYPRYEQAKAWQKESLQFFSRQQGKSPSPTKSRWSDRLSRFTKTLLFKNRGEPVG
jgi:hypothetical protein